MAAPARSGHLAGDMRALLPTLLMLCACSDWALFQQRDDNDAPDTGDKGYIEGYFVESAGGPPRKYYRILPDGSERLDRWASEWQTVSNGVGAILNGGSNGGSRV